MLRDGLNFYCVDCWAEIEPCLASLCSMRCADCRDGLTEPEVSTRSSDSTTSLRAALVGNAGAASGSVNPSEPWPVWFARTQGVPA